MKYDRLADGREIYKGLHGTYEKKQLLTKKFQRW